LLGIGVALADDKKFRHAVDEYVLDTAQVVPPKR
jgi:hypothetical protein